MSSSSSMDGDRHIDEINVSSGDEGVPNVQPSNVDSQKKKRKRGTNVRQGVKIYHSKSNPKKKRHLKAGCWDHFDPFTDSEDGAFKGRCIYCKAIYHADTSKNGTSNLNRHMVSGTSYPVAHRFFMEVLDIDEHLREWEKKVTYGDMVGKMREKFKKYWGDFSKLNMYMYFALILDPCMKMTSIEYGFKILMSYDRKPEILDDEFEGMVAEKAGVVEKAFGVLFAKYKATYDSLGETSQKPSNKSSNEVAPSQSRNSVVNAFLFGREGGSYKVATELDKYLSEPREELHTGFDILLWWKLNGPRFPILSRMAKDILAIQVSTVASESAFSTGGRILDPYRTRLSTSLVEALICLQDWVKNKMMVNMDDEVVDLEKDEDVVRDMEEEVRKMTITR